MPDATDKTAKDLFGKESGRATTRDRLIDTALDLFHIHGFHAVGIDRIIASVGVTKTTFYNHFESKDELMVAALKRRDEWDMFDLTRRIEEKAGDDPRAAMLAVFDVIDDWFTDPDYAGCIFINACAEFPSEHDPIHRAAADHYVAAEASIRDLAERAGVGDPADLARKLIILVEGTMLRRQITFDNDSARLAKQAAELLLREHLPQQ